MLEYLGTSDQCSFSLGVGETPAPLGIPGRKGGVGTSGTIVWEPPKAIGTSGQSLLAVGTHGIAQSQPATSATRFHLQIPPG